MHAQLGTFRGMQGLNYFDINGNWQADPPGVGPGSIVVQGQTSTGQTVTGTGHSTRDAWLSFANNVWSGLSGYLNQGQQIKLLTIQSGLVANNPNNPAAGGDLITQVTTFVKNNQLLVAAGAVGIALLMVNPPSKRK